MKQEYYGLDYKPNMPTMDRQTFHPVTGVSFFEWSAIEQLCAAYNNLRYFHEPIDRGGREGRAPHSFDRFNTQVGEIREKITGLLVDSIHEIGARREARRELGYDGGGTVTELMRGGKSADVACRTAAKEAAKEMGLGTAGIERKPEKGKAKGKRK